MRVRDCQLNIRLTSQEMMLLKRQAVKAKYSVSNYVRALINGNSPKECPPLDVSDLMVDIQDSILLMEDILSVLRKKECFDKGEFAEFDRWVSDELLFQKDIYLKLKKAIHLPAKAKV